MLSLLYKEIVCIITYEYYVDLSKVLDQYHEVEVIFYDFRNSFELQELLCLPTLFSLSLSLSPLPWNTTQKPPCWRL
jgi:hypothetical protein